MSVLRVYKPEECDGDGVPLDWEKCRTCEGGTVVFKTTSMGLTGGIRPCEPCGDHGSLKAACLHYLAQGQMWAEVERRGDLLWPRDHEPRPSVGDIGELRREVESTQVVRCQVCSHPMTEGTWEGGEGSDFVLRGALEVLAAGREPWSDGSKLVHHSACDDRCRHGRPPMAHACEFPDDSERGFHYEATWRHVDVWPLSWAHDLRPEMIAVLCLRCAAQGGTGSTELVASA